MTRNRKTILIRAIADSSDPQPWEFEERDPEPWEFYDDGSSLPWTYDDGGLAAIAPNTDDAIGDCVTRAIAIATGRPYAEVYDMVDKFGRAAGYLGIACLGVPHELTDELISEITGWRWVPLRNARLVTGDLPDESRLIAVMSNHVCAVFDGVIRDVRDCVWDDDEHEQRVSVEGVYLPPGRTGGLGRDHSLRAPGLLGCRQAAKTRGIHSPRRDHPGKDDSRPGPSFPERSCLRHHTTLKALGDNMPGRMQRPRIWRNRPPGAVDCTRGNVKYGNPFVIGMHAADRAEAVVMFPAWQLDPLSQPEIRFGPKGKRTIYRPQTAETLDELAKAEWLACCKPEEPCHYDVYLELLANRPAHLRHLGGQS